MARPYGDKFLLGLGKKSESNALGLQLARTCIAANLPVVYVAEALRTSKTTVHNWFRETYGVHEKNRAIVEAFIEAVQSDLKVDLLPVNTTKEARDYLRSISRNLTQ